MESQKRILRRFLFRLICLLVFLGLLGFCYRVFNRETVEEKPESVVTSKTAEIEVRRGSLLDRSGNPLAASLVDSSIYVTPREFSDIAGITEKLAELLSLDPEDLLSELKTQKSFIWLARHVPYKTAQKIEDLNLSGVYVDHKVKRVYSHNFKVPAIIGEVSQEEGLSGLEYYYNDLLLGGNGNGEQPRDLFLTLDLDTQVLLEEKLSTLLAEFKPEKAGPRQRVSVKGIVMNSKTGGIVACAQKSSGTGGSVSLLTLGQQSSQFFSDYIDPGAFRELFRQAATLRMARDKPADNATDEPNIIKDAKLKVDINPSPTPDPAWRKSAGGSLVYPWFARMVNKQEFSESFSETKHVLSDLELATFSAGLRFSSPVSLDLPEQEFLEPDSEQGGTFLVDEKAKVLPLNLLSGFSCLMTGKYPAPHFLKSASPVLEEGQSSPERDISGGICKGVGPKLLSRLSHSTASRDPVYIIESLQPKEDCRFEKDEKVECIDGVMLALANPGQKISGNDSGLVMLLTIENGVIDLYRSSPVRPVINDFLLTAVKNLNRQDRVSQDEAQSIAEKYLNRWLLTEEKKNNEFQNGDGEPGWVMPDLRGMSIRQALRRLQHRDLQIFVYGSGIIIKQHPEPGARVEDTRCVLTADFSSRAENMKENNG
ncbi:MAG: PASTA domain-containing protein [Desulfurivibrionaceae bacterium]